MRSQYMETTAAGVRRMLANGLAVDGVWCEACDRAPGDDHPCARVKVMTPAPSLYRVDPVRMPYGFDGDRDEAELRAMEVATMRALGVIFGHTPRPTQIVRVRVSDSPVTTQTCAAYDTPRRYTFCRDAGGRYHRTKQTHTGHECDAAPACEREPWRGELL